MAAAATVLLPVRGRARREAETSQLGTGDAGHDALVEVLAVVDLKMQTRSHQIAKARFMREQREREHTAREMGRGEGARLHMFLSSSCVAPSVALSLFSRLYVVVQSSRRDDLVAAPLQAGPGRSPQLFL